MTIIREGDDVRLAFPCWGDAVATYLMSVPRLMRVAREEARGTVAAVDVLSSARWRILFLTKSVEVRAVALRVEFEKSRRVLRAEFPVASGWGPCRLLDVRCAGTPVRACLTGCANLLLPAADRRSDRFILRDHPVLTPEYHHVLHIESDLGAVDQTEDVFATMIVDPLGPEFDRVLDAVFQDRRDELVEVLEGAA